MAFVTKVWKNRLVEFAGRRKLKNVVTGEEMIVDVSRSEGAVSQTGDAFSDTSMNNLEQRIKNQFDTVDSNLVPAPDYNSKISISASGFTATNNGWLTVSLKSNGSSAYCKVNNNYACGGSIAVTTSYPVVFCNTIPVSRNDVISFEIGTNASFVSAFFISK